MIRTLIIEDEPAIQQDVQALLGTQAGFDCIGIVGTITEAKVLIAATKPDLLLLDIELTDGTAFELLKSIDTDSFKIIFITAYQHYALRAIKFGAFDYLLKPIEESEFATALQNVRNAIPSSVNTAMQLQIALESNQDKLMANRLVLRSKNYLEIVEYAEILYCQGDAGYTTFFLAGNRKITTSVSIKEYEALLPASSFIRTHQSYLVNLNCVRKYYKEGTLVLKTGEKVPVATRKKETILKLLGHE